MGKNNKNKGFTLIELVISVAILAIVTAPILNAFVIAAKNTSTANARQIANNHAESVMEKFKATSFEMLTEEFTLIDKAVIADNEGTKYYYYDVATDSYVFSVPGSELSGGASDNFRVDVTMKPEKYDAPDLADVDGTKTAMLISEVYRYDENALIELTALANAKDDSLKDDQFDKIDASGNPNASLSENIRDNIVREVYIEIMYGTGTAPYSVLVDVSYSCRIGSALTVSKVYQKVFLNNYENVPDVLMFYAPYQYTTPGLYRDKIIVNNSIPNDVILAAGKKSKVYISNQEVSAISGCTLKYQAGGGNIVIKENNLEKDIYSDNLTTGLRNTEVLLSESITGAPSGETNSLVGKKEAVKIYGLTVDVFWNGEITNTMVSTTDGQN
ncbi:MAG: prepilin-type N-terminal cleavage/methylation domain-containing protein [Lachnospiraceae bacterium]|nr:prepilin-type N-terminal cleavage/methylation domain-containing protein [Lachnospiraceae bacterium]